MNRFIKHILTYLAVALTILAFSWITSDSRHFTTRDVVASLVESLCIFIVVTGVVNWVGRQQSKKA